MATVHYVLIVLSTSVLPSSGKGRMRCMRRDILISLPSPSMRCSGAAQGVGLVSYRDRLWILRAFP